MSANKGWASLLALGVTVSTLILSGCTTPALPPVATSAPAAATTAPAVVAATKPAGQSVAPTAAAAKGEPKQGGTLVFGWAGEPVPLDCYSGSLFNSRITADTICENLVGEDTTVVGQPSAPVKPKLAEKWDISADGLTYTFQLRKGVKFTDGTPFDAEAVKVNFDRYLAKDDPVYDAKVATSVSSLTAPIASYRVVDPSTFEIKLKEPFGSFILYLKHRQLGIMSPKALREHTHDMAGQFISGTGPFKFSKQEQGVQVVLEKNPDYWDKSGGPYLDKIIYRIMPDDSARIAALQAGEIDVSILVPAARVKDLQADPKLQLVFPSHSHIFYWQVNFQKPALQDPRVRQALWHAIDTEGMVKSIFGDTALAVVGFMPPGNPGYRPDLKRPYPFDPAKAKQLLAEAGHATDLKIVLAYPLSAGSYSEPVAVAQWTQSNLKAVGIDAQLDPYEFAAYGSFFRGKGLAHSDLKQMGWQSIADKPYMMDQVFSTAAIATENNPGGWSNAAFDQLVAKARPLPLEQAIPIYQQAEDLLVKEVGFIPILHDKQPRVFAKRVQNLKFGPSTWWEVTNVWIDPTK